MRDSDNWPPQDETTARSWEQRTAQRRRRRSGPLTDPRLVPIAIAVAVVLLVIAGIWLWSRPQPLADSGARRPVPATATPAFTPTPAPTPTPTVRQARIVRLGGGPGLLHESPGFNTPVLSVILKEGDVVELLNRQKQDAEGNSWRLVAIGDTVGWSPANNVEPIP
jgi:hypothetical protein